MHLGHYGESALNRKQRDAVRALRLLKEGQVQAVNGPPGTGKTSLLKTLVADAVVNAAAYDKYLLIAGVSAGMATLISLYSSFVSACKVIAKT